MHDTAIVLGATGLVGRALVDRLARARHVGAVVTLTRRSVSHSSPKVRNHVVDFERLDDFAALFHGEWLFSALGTTIGQAGSREAQRLVDVDYQLTAARLAAAAGVRHYLLVSAPNANARSRNFYTRIKGELEEHVLRLPFPRISIFQPSVLVGARERPRPVERWAGAVLGALLPHVPRLRRYRPIRGDEVAARMVEVGQAPGPAVEVFTLDGVFPRGASTDG